MKTDYLIVGFGLGGATFAATLDKNGKSFVVIDRHLHPETRVIGGMYNPIILKRFTPAWKAHEFWVNLSKPFYENLEKQWKTTLIYPFPVFRIFQSIEEQNLWVSASGKPVMEHYMSPEIHTGSLPGIRTPYGYGKLNRVGRVDGETFINTYRNILDKRGVFLCEEFDYQALQISKKSIEYRGIEARKLVFAEGARLKNNPYFKHLPLMGTKGEMMVVKIADIPPVSIKSSVFMIHMGGDKYIVGSTYNWEDKSPIPTRAGKTELTEKLERFLQVPYRITGRKSGIRPTVIDRRPLLGKHPDMSNLSVLNGLGTRGIIFAPALSEILYRHIEYDTALPEQMNITRFDK